MTKPIQRQIEDLENESRKKTRRQIAKATAKKEKKTDTIEAHQLQKGDFVLLPKRWAGSSDWCIAHVLSAQPYPGGRIELTISHFGNIYRHFIDNNADVELVNKKELAPYLANAVMQQEIKRPRRNKTHFAFDSVLVRTIFNPYPSDVLTLNSFSLAVSQNNGVSFSTIGLTLDDLEAIIDALTTTKRHINNYQAEEQIALRKLRE